jgi:hypothetical protein
MTDPSLIALFVRPLNQLRIPYLVTGGVASVIYGEPRFTRDIDLVIQLHPRDARRFAQVWPADDFYVPPIEVLEAESRRPTHGHFNVSHHRTAMRADVYLAGNDPLNAWAFQHKVMRRIVGDEVCVAPIEAVMLSISCDLVNVPELERWSARLGVEREWRQAQDYREEP